MEKEYLYVLCWKISHFPYLFLSLKCWETISLLHLSSLTPLSLLLSIKPSQIFFFSSKISCFDFLCCLKFEKLGICCCLYSPSFPLHQSFMKFNPLLVSFPNWFPCDHLSLRKYILCLISSISPLDEVYKS